MASARHPGGPEHVLHASLVAEADRGLRVHPGDAELLPHLGQRHLEVLEDAQGPIDRPEPPPGLPHAVGERPCVEAVVDADVGRQGRGQRSGHLLRGLAPDQGDAHTRQADGGVDESHRRLQEVRRDEHDVGHQRGTVTPSPAAGYHAELGAARNEKTMNVVFIEPAFPANQRAFVLALAGVGATVIGIGERHVDELDDELKAAMVHYEQVHSVVDEGALLHAVRRDPGPHLGRSTGGDGRGPHHGRRARARGLHHPGHLGPHRLPLPRQAEHEGGAQGRRRALRAPRPARHRSPRSRRSSPRSATR